MSNIHTESQVILQEIVSSTAGASINTLRKACLEMAPSFRVFIYDTRLSGFVEVNSDEYQSKVYTVDELESSFKAIRRVYRANQIVSFYMYGADDKGVKEKIQYFCNYIPFLYNRRVANRVLKNLHEPVDYEEPEVFFGGVCEIAKKCSGMELGAYRRLDGNMLKCEFAWTKTGTVSRDDLAGRDCRIDTNRYFLEAIKSREISICDDLPIEMPEYSKREGQEGVITFCVIPVIVANNCLGIFSIAQKSLYEFSWAEKQGFSTIANAIGVSVSNFDYYHQSMSMARQKEKDEALITAVGVVQGVRHHLKAQARLLTSNVARLRDSKQINKRFVDITELIDDISQEITDSLDRMKKVMDFERTIEEMSLDELIKEVYLVHHHKLTENRITYSYQNGSKENKKIDQNFLTLPTIIRSTLHHLFLNSIDALEQVSYHRRKIHISTKFHRSKGVSIEFLDSGPGLNKSAILFAMSERYEGDDSALKHYIDQIGKGNERKAAYEWIFREGYTSKPDGSGHGLSLSRRHMKQVGGSLEAFDPYDSDWSIGFRVTFPISVESIFKANQNGKLIIDQSAEFYSKYENEILESYFEYEDNVTLEFRNSSLKYY